MLKIPPDAIVFLDKRTMSQAKIEQGLERFQGKMEEVDGKAALPRYIIATTSSFGAGLTLSEVIGIVLLEPDFRLSLMLQLFARHNRQGNKNQEIYS